jgi:GNAT superfamily N-acetyltransferase
MRDGGLHDRERLAFQREVAFAKVAASSADVARRLRNDGRPARGQATWGERSARLADPNGATFLAIADGEDVGLVTGHAFQGPDGAAGLVGMRVEPSHRGRGIAGDLVDAVVAWACARGFDRVLLDVADANAAANAL